MKVMNEARILIVSHGHPDFSQGGVEVAAFAHWSELRRRGMEAMLVARVADSPGHAGAPFFSRSADGMEVLFCPPAVNHFRHSQPHRQVIYQDFRALLERFRPTAVHFHHYAHMGLEMIREVRKYGPDVPIVLTLHEFLAICNAQGQMLKTNGMLCQKAAPLDCHLCFPGISAQDFFMRELFVKSFLGLVDHFICPSEFLRDRYVAWGLPADRLKVLENGQPRELMASRDETDEALQTQFVVLGQVSQRKGSLVLLEAIRLLPKRIRKLIRIEIHGSTQYAEDDFKLKFQESMRQFDGTVTACGPYIAKDVGEILRRNGWLIVPSIWWENWPTVIQEAFAAGRPVICSDIGGMAEKVKHGVSGMHFRGNNAAHLSARIEECATAPELWKRLCAGVPKPPTIDQTVDEMLGLYGSRTGSVTQRVGSIAL